MMVISGLELTKCLSEKQTWKSPIRMLLQKQSDLGLPCFSRLLWQATTVANFRTFTFIVFMLHFLTEIPDQTV